MLGRKQRQTSCRIVIQIYCKSAKYDAAALRTTARWPATRRGAAERRWQRPALLHAEMETRQLLAASAAAAALVAAALLGSAAGRDDPQRALCDELRGLRLRALRARALAAGVGEERIEEALDADDPKAELVDLVLVAHAGAHPACDLQALPALLEKAIEAIEHLSIASPRRLRREARGVVDRAEATLDDMVDDWSDGLSQCGADELERLAAAMTAVENLSSAAATPNVAAARLAALLDACDRCWAVVPRAASALRNHASDTLTRSRALESIRCLSEERLDAACADEAAAYEAVQSYVRGLDACVGTEVVSGCMALYTLCCRNGLALCGSADVIETAGGLLDGWLERASSDVDEYEAGAAASALLALYMWECGPKTPSESRRPWEQVCMSNGKLVLDKLGKAVTEQRACQIFTDSMKAGMLSHEDISLACGWTFVLFFFGYMHPSALVAANEAGIFRTAVVLIR